MDVMNLTLSLKWHAMAPHVDQAILGMLRMYSMINMQTCSSPKANGKLNGVLERPRTARTARKSGSCACMNSWRQSKTPICLHEGSMVAMDTSINPEPTVPLEHPHMCCFCSFCMEEEEEIHYVHTASKGL